MSNASSGKRAQDDLDLLHRQLAELRASRRRLAVAAQADRRAIERDLHDGVQQQLVALALELQGLARLLDGDSGAAKTLVVEMAGTVREAVDQTARLATRIYPQILDGRGFAGAIRAAATEAGVTVVVGVPANVDYPPEVAIAAYWTFIEALSSASAGSETGFRAFDLNGGVGLEITIAERHPAALLERLRDRIEALDGRLNVEERDDGGSRIQGWLPLPR
jgi:signal transduction histidine kinase